MSLGSHHTIWYLRPGILFIGIEVAQLETGYQQAAQTLVEIGLTDITTAHSLGQVLVFRATLHIGTSQHGLGRGFGRILGGVVPAGQEIANGTTIAGDESVESPFIAQDLLFVTRL